MKYAAYLSTGRIITLFDATDDEHAQTAATADLAVIAVADDVSDETHYIDAGVAVPFPVKPDPVQTWDWATKAWVDARTLDEIKAAKWTAIKAQRDAIEYGTFTWDGSTFDADPVSTSRIMGAFALALAAQAAGAPYSETWTLANNETRTLSAADMMAVGAALGAQVSAAFATATTLRAAIDAATTAEEVGSVAWPA